MTSKISPVTTVLNPLESFNFGFKYLWSNDSNAKAKLNVIDTIIFKDGKPFYWIFTSEKTGVIEPSLLSLMHSYH